MKNKTLIMTVGGCLLLFASVLFLSGNNNQVYVAFAYAEGQYVAGTESCEQKPGDPPGICSTRPCCAEGSFENCMEGLCQAHCQPKDNCKKNVIPN